MNRLRTNSGSALRANANRGLTIIELMLGVAIVAILVMLAVGQFGDYQERARVNEAITFIRSMEVQIRGFQLINGRVPDDLNDVALANTIDPWGRAYIFTNLTGPGNGASRKDRRLNPLNSDFDLFSAGKDGQYQTQITHRTSLDDVIRASDGAFVDLASKF